MPARAVREEFGGATVPDFLPPIWLENLPCKHKPNIYTAWTVYIHQAYSDWRQRAGHGATPTHSHIAVPIPRPLQQHLAN